MAFKVYTKTGDKGQTSLLGGTRLPKHHIRIEAYGTVDELNSYIGLVRDQAIDAHSKAVLIEIQDRLFTLGSLLAADPKKNKMKLPEVSEEDVTYLEKEIDKMDEVLPEMKHFVLPGGHTTVSFCHIARCVCRRAERATLKLSENEEVGEIIIKYLNRLSDYLFVLSRKLAMDSNAEEIPWKPRV
ncbi:MAG: ATP:cob(I)alamin adenosyltransferase [Bacteroidetes bacterium]|jgi:cob(I)alamin adenosyltransferase|nr:ATP:cob(I)alamin adenosyltransferase [Bacteroidota bacterium]